METRKGYHLRNLLAGIISGVIAGLLFPLVYMSSSEISELSYSYGGLSKGGILVLHLVIAALEGGFFALLFHRITRFVSVSIFCGIIYALFLFLLVHMLLIPSLTHEGIRKIWTQFSFIEFAPFFLGHIFFGVFLGVLYPWFHKIVRYYD